MYCDANRITATKVETHFGQLESCDDKCGPGVDIHLGSQLYLSDV